jgi:hypothetical protein
MMRLSFFALTFSAILICGCNPPDGGSGDGSMPTDPGLPGDTGSGDAMPTDPGLPGGGAGLPGGTGSGDAMPTDPSLPGGDACPPVDGFDPQDPGLPGGAGMVVVSNFGSEATNPPDGPIAVAVVAGSDQPQSADDYTILALGESQSFPVSGDTFTIFVCDPADPVNTVYEQQTVDVGSMGQGPVCASSSEDCGGKTTIAVP